MKPRRPYLLRALHEWISDSGDTPHLVVDAGVEGVLVPQQYVKDGKIVLNVSHSATQFLNLGNEAVSFEARFGGVGCRKLLGKDLNNPEEAAQALEQKLYKTVCVKYVRGAIEILDELLAVD